MYNNTIGSFYTLAPNGTPILPTFASALSTLILGGPNSNPIVFASGYGSPFSSLFYDPERYVHAFNPGAGTIYWRTDDRDLGDIQNVRASVLHELLHSWVQSDKKIQEFFGIEQDDYFTDNITAKLRSEGCP